MRRASRRKAAERPTASSTGKAAIAAATRPSASATQTTSPLDALPGSASERSSRRSARSLPPAKRLYMSAALWWRRRAAAWKSAGSARRTSAKRGHHRPQALLERGGHPPELALGLAGLRAGVPEEEVQLALGEERRLADRPRYGLAAGRGDLCERHRHHGRHPPAPGEPNRGLGQLAEAHVAVAEDVALARRAPVRRQQM